MENNNKEQTISGTLRNYEIRDNKYGLHVFEEKILLMIDQSLKFPKYANYQPKHLAREL